MSVATKASNCACGDGNQNNQAFSMFWKLIKVMLHPRTTAKIEIYANEKEGHKRLGQLIDQDQLLCDYGGNEPTFDSSFHLKTKSTRHAVQLMKSNNGSL